MTVKRRPRLGTVPRRCGEPRIIEPRRFRARPGRRALRKSLRSNKQASLSGCYALVKAYLLWTPTLSPGPLPRGERARAREPHTSSARRPLALSCPRAAGAILFARRNHNAAPPTCFIHMKMPPPPRPMNNSQPPLFALRTYALFAGACLQLRGIGAHSAREIDARSLATLRLRFVREVLIEIAGESCAMH